MSEHQTDPWYASAHELARRVRTGETGALELTDAFIDRIEARDPEVNAVVVRDFDRARAAARAADAARARGDATGPLHGVPMTVKESFCIAGLPTHFGIPAFRDSIADQDAVVVERLKAAGAILLGKTNVPWGLADFQTYNEIHGTTHNPWAPGHTPGGSSGGSAAALAAGFTPLEMGSDIGGSIRNPAHFCGVFGHKPTFRLLPSRGHALAGAESDVDIAVVGPLARNVDDLTRLFRLQARPDPLTGGGLEYRLPTLAGRTLGDLRIGAWLDDAVFPVSGAVRTAGETVARAIESAGGRVDRSARPAFEVPAAHRTYQYLLHAAMSAQVDDAQFVRARATVEASVDAEETPALLVFRASTLSHRDWLRWNEAREHLRLAWRALFDRYDAVLMPVTATAAFPHDESPRLGARTIDVDGQSRRYFDQVFWAGITGAAYLPSTVIPAGHDATGLPIGLQVVGPEYGDLVTLGIAGLLEREGFAFRPPPAFADA